MLSFVFSQLKLFRPERLSQSGPSTCFPSLTFPSSSRPRGCSHYRRAAAVLSLRCLHIAEQINCQAGIVCTLLLNLAANWLLGNLRGGISAGPRLRWQRGISGDGGGIDALLITGPEL